MKPFWIIGIRLLVAAVVITTSPGLAQLHPESFGGAARETAFGPCQGLVGETVAFDSPERVVGFLDEADFEKGEFETSEQFEIRLAPIREMLDGPMTLPVDLSRDYVVYDADAQEFNVRSWAFPEPQFTLTRWHDRKGINLGVLDRVAVTLRERSKTLGSYTATNAFGVAAVVAEVDKTVISAFERASSSTLEEDLFGVGRGGRRVMGFASPIGEARTVKESLVGGVIFHPKPPFLIKGEYHHDATIHNKRQLSEYDSVLIGDFECAFVANADGAVLAATQTN